MESKFTNQNLQNLYELVNSDMVAKLQTPEDIHAVIYPFIKSVIDNPSSLEEASKWTLFRGVLNHLETKKPSYTLMPYEISMAFDLYMYIYH